MNKNSKKICIIRSNPIRPDSRVEKEAWSLKKEGFVVTILAWDRDSDHINEEDIITVAGLDIPIVRIGCKATFGEGFKNIIPYLSFQFRMMKWLCQNSTKYDAIHACDFDTAFFSLKIAKLKKKKFVFDIFDFLYTEPRNLLQKIIKKSEINIINKADATIICTEERQKQIIGANPKILIVIHNSPTKALMTTTYHKHNSTEKVKFAYIGILQDYRLLLELGKFFSEHKEYEFHIGGFGKYEHYFIELANSNNNIFFYGRVPYEKTLEIENNCDIMLAIYDPQIDNHKFAAPNKFYEALMLGKPVIMVNNTGMANVISKNDFGILIDYDINSFSKGVNAIIKKQKKWNDSEKIMKHYFHDNYSWSIMEKRLIKLYNSILENDF